MAKIAPAPYRPDVAVPPGATIRELLEVKGMTQQELAERMDRPPNKVNEILQGKRAITVDTAMALELVLGWPAEFWLEREKNYQLSKARLDAQASLEEQVVWVKKLPLREMVKFGWVKRLAHPASQVRALLAFFGVASFAQLDKPSVCPAAFRKAAGKQACPYALAAWLRKGKLLAAEIKTSPFNAARLKADLGKLRALTCLPPEQFEGKVVSLCASHGVAVVFVPHLPKSYVNGAAYWLGGKAVVQLSLRFRMNDIFWFSFFHELAHILLHGKRETFLDDFAASEDEQEREADAFAARTLIGDEDYRRLVKSCYRQAQVIEEFAAEVGVAPGIVVGRLQHEGLLSYNQLNGLRVPLAWVHDVEE